MSLSITLRGTYPQHAEQALAALAGDLQIALCETGTPVIATKGDALSVSFDGSEIRITWAQPVQFYRALSLVPQPLVPFSTSETPCFETVGLMFDVSRNAVLKPETVQFFLRKMAMMGLNLGMMYTEDTYEVPSQPYFGYQRGRYSIDDLRALDDYADLFGIELCPCIQTLGHLNRALHWPALCHLKDNEEVLLVDDESTYAFVEELISAATLPYRSNRIHLGMDEAHGIGLGAHLRKYGYENPHHIIKRHLERVLDITRAKGLSPLMWSDMYFRSDSPTGGYYDGGMPSEESIAAVSPDVTLVYWDYCHNDEEGYEQMFKKHAALPTQTVFAGGIWTWAGPAPDYTKTLQTSVPALNACKKANIPFVLATSWGDNGTEANLTTALLGMQLYAEFTYAGAYDAEVLAARFKRVCRADAQAFLDLSRFNTVEGMKAGAIRPVNAAKFLLYQDPLVQLYAEDTAGLAMSAHYEKLVADYTRYAQENVEFTLLFEFYTKLAVVLAGKCFWHEHASAAVRTHDMALAQQLIDRLAQTIEDVGALRVHWRALWESTNRPYGFEILDFRQGGLQARLATAAARMQDFVDGKISDIPELSETALPYTRIATGELMGSYAMNEIVSACKLDL